MQFLFYSVLCVVQACCACCAADCLCIRSHLGRVMAVEAASSMLDGREFEILLAVIFSMGIFSGFVLSQAFCKSRGVKM